MFAKFFPVLLTLIFSSVAFAQNKSIYTDLAADKCKTISVNKGMAGNYTGRCKGTGGFELEVYLDDERNSVGVVLPSKKIVGLDFWNYFHNFSALGEKAEWRTKNGKPAALIVRINVSEQEYPKPAVSYLVVSKIDGENSCVTDIIKPGRNQNAEARKSADNAPSRPCRKFH